MTIRRASFVLAFLAIGVGTTTHPSLATWSHNPTVNLPVCTATGDQDNSRCVSDGHGGAIMAWQDRRAGNLDIYAQHVLASGRVDPAWPSNGSALCTASGDQQTPEMVSDGNGGAIVIWSDNRASNWLVYAQRVLPSGVVDPAWPPDGLPVCDLPSWQGWPMVAIDGNGGLIIAWNDTRNGNMDIYAQHVVASGTVDPAWPPEGLALCTDPTDQNSAVIATDGLGGAIVAWRDMRTGDGDTYAQHALSSGVVDPAWPASGVRVAYNGQESSPAIVSDDAGGAIVAWLQDAASINNVYAQHVLASGALDSFWPSLESGRQICSSSENQTSPRLVADGAGGAIVAWSQYHGSWNQGYVQHVFSNGAIDDAWPATGVPMCSGGSYWQSDPVAVSDGSGGVYVSWNDGRSGGNDVFGEHILPSGEVDGWPGGCRAVCTNPSTQAHPAIVPDGDGGIVFCWTDVRSGHLDIYAQRIEQQFGYLGHTEPAIARVKDVLNDQGGQVVIEWTASYLDAAPSYGLDSYSIWRRVPVASAPGDLDALEAVGRLLKLTIGGGPVTYWEHVLSQPARGFTGYSCVVPTTCDSIPGSNPLTCFMVMAEGDGGTPYWASDPDSGYSVDNLSPAMPQNLAGQWASNEVTLTWTANQETDLSCYRLYRGIGKEFVPGPSTLVAVLQAPGYVDHIPDVTRYTYKLCAVDLHENVSLFQCVNLDGPTAVLLTIESAVYDDGAVHLSWRAPANPRVAASVYKHGTDVAWQRLCLLRASRDGTISYADAEVQPGNRYGYRLGIQDGSREVFCGEAWVEVPFPRLTLREVSPNPATWTTFRVAFTLPDAEPARLELFDIQGRLVHSQEVGSLGAGSHEIHVSSGTPLPAGIYLIRLAQAEATTTRKAVIVK